MSAKILSSLTDENIELRKQIGCMNGIFQIFDRQHFLTGRRLSNHSHKRLLPGSNHNLDIKVSNHNLDIKPASRAATEKTLAESQTEKSRVSIASYASSSCSSTLSSHDCNRAAQPKALPLDHNNTPQTPSQTQTMAEQKIPAHPVGLRDVVKDSMNRETRGLSLKVKAKDQRRNVMKHIDSPRPLQQTRKDEGLSRPRLSYDESESRDTLKSATKLKELPRLSLDSRASSMRSSDRRDFLLRVENEKSSKDEEEPGSTRRASSVVAKLMGLEALPNVISSERMINIQSIPDKESVVRSAKATDQDKRNQVPSSPRGSEKSSSPVKPISRFPLEPAPWRKPESSQSSRSTISKGAKAPGDSTKLSLSVYGEIEKRVTELEFKKSGKDLRALKQILEAMQKTRHRLENQNGNSNDFASQTRRYSADQESMRQDQESNTPVLMIKGRSSTQAKKMDQVKIPHRPPVPSNETAHQRRRQTGDATHNKEDSVQKNSAKGTKPMKINLNDSSQNLLSIDKKTSWRISEVKTSPHIKKENCTTSERSSGVVSPRLQQRRQEMVKNSSSSYSRGARKQSHNHLSESGRKQRGKPTNLQQGDDQLSTSSSVMSESNSSQASQLETEVIETNAKQHDESLYQYPAARLRKHGPVLVCATTMLEQPSPVSVLDATFDGDNSPSPVKKTSTAFRESDSLFPDETDWHLENPNPSYKYHEKKLENIKQLVHKLTLLSGTVDEASMDITVPINNSNPDKRYVTKILLASGLLKDVSTQQIAADSHSSCHLINPDLFHVLEQTEEEEKTRSKLNQKNHRKLVFDAVDEILARKFVSQGLFRRKQSPQELCKEVEFEMDRLQKTAKCSSDDEDDDLTKIITEDMAHQSADWGNYNSEISGLVLDVERLIFKDLINEVVGGEIISLHDRPRRHHRQLFTN